MKFILILIAVLIAASLLVIVRKKLDSKRLATYVCTTCGEMDCICHQKHNISDK